MPFSNVKKDYVTTHDSLAQRRDVPPNVAPNVDVEKEDWTGTKWATTHRCFGKPCKEDEMPPLWEKPKSLLQLERYNGPAGLPWEDNEFFHRNDEDMNLNVKRFNEASNGIIKT